MHTVAQREWWLMLVQSSPRWRSRRGFTHMNTEKVRRKSTVARI